jgi:catalase
MYDAVYVPGGPQSIEALKLQGDAIHFVNEAFKHCKAIAASGEGVELLRQANFNYIQFAGADRSGKPISDKGVVTTSTMADPKAFTQEFINAITQHRHWSRQMKERVPA